MHDGAQARETIWSAQCARLSIKEDAPASSVLRVRPADRSVTDALGARFALDWPIAANTCARAGGVEVTWFGPREWAVVGIAHDEVARIAGEACVSGVYHVANTSDAWRRWRISGAAAELLLAKGCSLDLHTRSFAANGSARSLLGQVPILLIRTPGGWVVHAEASLATFIRTWFEHAGRELGLS